MYKKTMSANNFQSYNYFRPPPWAVPVDSDSALLPPRLSDDRLERWSVIGPVHTLIRLVRRCSLFAKL